MRGKAAVPNVLDVHSVGVETTASVRVRLECVLPVPHTTLGQDANLVLV